MRRFKLHILFTIVCFVYALTLSAQNLGINTIGSTTYPTTTLGNTAADNTSLNVANNYLVADQYTSTVPLTAIQILTKGSGGGNVKVSIYSNAAGNVPGTKLCAEVQVTGVSTSTWTTYTIAATYLTAGTYWIVFNCSVAKGVGQTNIVGPPRRFFSQTFGTAFQNDMSGLAWSAIGGNADATYIIGVPIQGYAKATKAVLATNGTFNSVSFYSHAAGNVRLAIFNDASGAPSAKQWESGDVAVSATAWTTVNISSGTPTSLALNPGTYWLAWQWNSATSGPSYTAGSANTGNFIIQSYGAFPSTWSGGTASAENWSMYATYVACFTPAAYNVTGGGGYCSGGSGVAIGLSNSQANVNYQLYLNGSTLVGSPVPGSGSAISFGSNITTGGTYTVTATTTTGGCTNNMTGSATVTINPLPSASVSGQSNLTCYLSGNGSITVSATGGTSPYTFSINNGANYVANGGLFTMLSAGQYQIRVKDNNGCESKQVQ